MIQHFCDTAPEGVEVYALIDMFPNGRLWRVKGPLENHDISWPPACPYCGADLSEDAE